MDEPVDIFSEGERRAYQLLFDERKSADQTSRELKAQGFNFTPEQLRAFKKNAFEILVKSEREERMSEMLLDSFERTKVEMEDVVSRLKTTIMRLDGPNQTFEQLAAIREMKDCLNMALKVQGKYHEGIQNIRAKTINIINSPEFMVTFKQYQNRMFSEMKAEINEGKLIFNNPSPEFIDDFIRWHETLPKKQSDRTTNFAPYTNVEFIEKEEEKVEGLMKNGGKE
jgi:exonuclease VII small subunit